VTRDWPEYKRALRLSRRRMVIAVGAAAASMVTCAGLVATPVLRRGPYAERPTGLLLLKDLDYAVYQALGALILGQDEDLDAVIRRIDRTLAELDPLLRRQLLSYPMVLEGSGFVGGGRLRPFTELPQADQRRVFEHWAGSHVLLWRQVATSLRQLLTAHRGAP